MKLAFYRYFSDIYEAYEYAGIKYERACPVILGRKKEKVMTNITEKLFRKMGYEIVRVSVKSEINNNRGPDMILKDRDGNIILVEIKAYRKEQSITIREMNQLRRYLGKWNTEKGMFLTTSESIREPSNNIIFINGVKLKSFLKKYGMINEIESILWIQRAKVIRKEVMEHRDKIRRKIIEYVKVQDHIPTRREIENILSLDTRSCFSSLREIYELAGIELPNTVLTKKEIRARVIEFIGKCAKVGMYPNTSELHKRFGINLGTYFGSGNTIKKTYITAGIDYKIRKTMFPLSKSAYNESSLPSLNPS